MMRMKLYTRTTFVLVLMLVSLSNTSAWAQDDGGARSILADGAGNRALGMGGAYVAIADDASAAVWNPAGLGFVQRREFQATHTDLMGLGFNEQYASFVLPSWRWGAASLTFRRFGVDGIEGRDDRNILTDADLSDSETELSLGYGRGFGEAWSLGAALKLRSQNLAGFSDSGLGVDLGATVRPLVVLGSSSQRAQDLTLGIALRNAVEPSLRLNEEPVKDPAGVRIGGAYRWRFGRQGEVLTAVDVEKTRDMDANLHAGIEVRVVNPMTLRLGTNQGRFVAGASLNWRDVGVDYQFENHPSEFFHRFGLSLKFGPSRDDAQQMDTARREQEFQQQLASAFDDQRRHRKRELLSKTRSALTTRDAEAAASLLAMIEVLDPDTPELTELGSQIFVLQATEHDKSGDYVAAMVALRRALDLDPNNQLASAMAVRIRKASDKQSQRTTKIRNLLNAAQEAFTAGELKAAQSGFRDVLDLAPQDKEAQAMLALTNLTITNQVESHLAQSRTLTSAKQFQRARQELAIARDLDAQAPGLAAANQFLADQEVADKIIAARPLAAPTTKVPTATAVTKEPTLTAQQKREAADLYKRGVDAMAAGQNDQALHYWELVWSIDPKHQNVTEYLAQNYLSRGMEFFVSGDLPEAVSNWEAAVRVDPDDPKAIGYLKRAREQAERLQNLDKKK